MRCYYRNICHLCHRVLRTFTRIMFFDSLSRTLLFLAGCVIILSAGCGKGIVVDTGVEYESRVNEGWDYYKVRDYEEAIQSFEYARSADDSEFGAYIGLGWSYFRAQNLPEAITHFRLAKTKASVLLDSIDVLSGLSGAYLASNQYSKAIQAVTADSLGYSDFILFHDPQLSEDSINLVLCQAYYHLGKYSSGESEDPENATYYLNKLLGYGVQYTYTNPVDLMEQITKLQLP